MGNVETRNIKEFVDTSDFLSLLSTFKRSVSLEEVYKIAYRLESSLSNGNGKLPFYVSFDSKKISRDKYYSWVIERDVTFMGGYRYIKSSDEAFMDSELQSLTLDLEYSRNRSSNASSKLVGSLRRQNISQPEKKLETLQNLIRKLSSE
jgi:hypothetical protein